jgi:hypoxanthine phosphoribosyltransferase
MENWNRDQVATACQYLLEANPIPRLHPRTPRPVLVIPARVSTPKPVGWRPGWHIDNPNLLAYTVPVPEFMRRGASLMVHDDIAEILVSEEEIEAKVAELGRRISEDYSGCTLLLIGLLRGAIVFLSDLMRAIDVPVALDFIGISSYGDSTESGAVRLVMDLETDIAGCHVLVVEDIVDTGRTLNYIVESLRARQPASLRICALLDKPERREVPIDVDYVGFTIPDKFVVGYGLDFAEGYRNLPFVGVLKEHLYKEVLVRGAILRQLNAYLNRQDTLLELVTWAREMLEAGGLSADDQALLQDMVTKAGEPGSPGFGLRLEDCVEYAERLGHSLRVSTHPIVG